MSVIEDVNYSNMLLKLLVQLYLWGLARVHVQVCAVVKRSILSYHLNLNRKIMYMLSSSLTVMLSCDHGVDESAESAERTVIICDLLCFVLSWSSPEGRLLLLILLLLMQKEGARKGNSVS